MKRFNIITALIFSALYGIFLSLGIECLLSLMGFIFTVSGIDDAASNRYAGFIAVCIIVGVLSVVSAVRLIIFNYKVAIELEFDKYVGWIEAAATCVTAFLMMKPWEELFIILKDVL